METQNVDLRPHGFGRLLDYIRLVASPTDDSANDEALDSPQIILYCWSDVVPWSWSIWKDQRSASQDVILETVILRH